MNILAVVVFVLGALAGLYSYRPLLWQIDTVLAARWIRKPNRYTNMLEFTTQYLIPNFYANFKRAVDVKPRSKKQLIQVAQKARHSDIIRLSKVLEWQTVTDSLKHIAFWLLLPILVFYDYWPLYLGGYTVALIYNKVYFVIVGYGRTYARDMVTLNILILRWYELHIPKKVQTQPEVANNITSKNQITLNSEISSEYVASILAPHRAFKFFKIIMASTVILLALGGVGSAVYIDQRYNDVDGSMTALMWFLIGILAALLLYVLVKYTIVAIHIILRLRP